MQLSEFELWILFVIIISILMSFDPGLASKVVIASVLKTSKMKNKS